jgi:hypothetical protein
MSFPPIGTLRNIRHVEPRPFPSDAPQDEQRSRSATGST